jgi:hypothetical protein
VPSFSKWSKKNSQQKLNVGDIQVTCDTLAAGSKAHEILGEVRERPERTDVAVDRGTVRCMKY